jgi:predicted enzyme related to lactoylglutathione lyase
MDAFQTHGAFSWNELMTPDPGAAANFYRQLLGWEFDTMAMGEAPYRVVKVDGQAVGGIMGMPPNAPPGMPPMWGCYVTVDNADETAGECAALGGKVLMPPTDIQGVGRFSVLQDPQGAVFSVIAYLDR